MTRKRHCCFAGPADKAIEWLANYVRAGAMHMMLRIAGDPEGQLDKIAGLRNRLAP